MNAKQAFKNLVFLGAMNLFVDDEDSYMGLESTFIQEGFEYATDGRILARRLTSKNENTKILRTGKAPPNVHSHYSREFATALPWFRFKLAKLQNLVGVGVCPVCEGRRVFLGDKYPPMNQYGEPDHVLYPAYDVDENTCGFRGCWKCKGDCYEVKGAFQKEFGKIYQFKYMKRISKLWFPEVTVSEMGLLMFRSRLMGIEGLLMHCTYSEKWEFDE